MIPVALPALRYATSAARLGSFSAAARACEVSQPTVSNAIADLEEALGARLFERTTRKLATTPAGVLLLPRVQAILDAVDELARETEALKRPVRKLVRIGFSQLVGAQRLALLFEPFGRAHRDVELIYKECSHGDMEARLDAGSVDFVCGAGLRPGRNRGRHLMHREPLRWVAPSGTPVGGPVTLREVARSRLVMTDGSCGLASAIRDVFARARISIEEYAGHAMSYAALEEWAELGIGGAVMPASHIRKSRSVAIELADRPLTVTYEAVWRKDLLVAQHTKAFVEYVRTVVPRLARTAA
jgi:DNA-binding transcriptional LysR family regulator